MVLDEEAKAKLRKIEENNQAIEQQHGTSERPTFREDGYINLLNKYGTSQDNTEAYRYVAENQTPDTILMTHYEQNGLFGKIIDIPAQEAVKKGFKLNIADAAVEDFIQKKVRRMKFLSTVEEALKWSRLFGGALAVMIIDDGINDLAQPVNWKKAKKIDEIVVYDRSCVTPDYHSMYRNYGVYGATKRSKFRMPEYYNVYSIYGSFRVHESRCLVFRNGTMPEKASTSDYRFWGVPEYNHIKRAMRETITAHGDAVKLLERSVQAVYKTKNLAQLLSTDEGENDVLRRLQVIDTARGILNSIAIDADGEEYDFKSITLSGVKEVIDSACNMLSALTEIPQTKLFGRSPAGMNATGESDLENYYSFVDKIRESQIRDNLCILVDAIIQIGINRGELTERPDYELEFEPLWNEKESERATIDETRARTDLTIAQTAQLYIDMGVLDPAEERKRLKGEGKFGIEDEELPQQDIDQPFNALLQSITRKDSADNPYDGMTGVGVVVFKDGKFLVGDRSDNNLICSPGGHIESWEDAERAAARETEEEFGITLKNLIPLGSPDDLAPEWGKTFIFLSTEFDGVPLTNTQEMLNIRFMDLYSLLNSNLYPPFKEGIVKLIQAIQTDDILTEIAAEKSDDNTDDNETAQTTEDEDDNADDVKTDD